MRLDKLEKTNNEIKAKEAEIRDKNKVVQAHSEIVDKVEKKSEVVALLLGLFFIIGLASIVYTYNQIEVYTALGKLIVYANTAIGVVIFAAVSIYVLRIRSTKNKIKEQHNSIEHELDQLVREAERLESESRSLEEGLKVEEELVSSLAECSAQTNNSLELASERLASTDQNIETARQHFEDGRFSPFWDSIEDSLRSLDEFHQSIYNINEHSKEYRKLLSTLNDANEGQPSFQIPNLPVTTDTSKQLDIVNRLNSSMRELVAKAQADIGFASIFEMKKTNSILISGFTSLSSAIEGVGDLIIEQLSSVSDELRNLDQTLIHTHNESKDVQLQMHRDSVALQNDSIRVQKDLARNVDTINKRYDSKTIKSFV